jgi:hypothetical protein
MANHLDEMKFFLDVVDAYSVNIINETRKENQKVLMESEIVESKAEAKEDVLIESFINDLSELKKDWLSISSEETNEQYSEGYERGLFKAVEMLENLLLTKYSRRI